MIDYDKLADLSGVDGLSDLYITFSEIDGSPLVYPVLNVNGKRVLGHNCIQGIHHHQVVETTPTRPTLTVVVKSFTVALAMMFAPNLTH